MAAEILVLEGDGISDEIMAPTLKVLDAVTDDLSYHHLPFGGRSIDLYNTPLTPFTLEACRQASAVLLAAVGGPKWDSTDPSAPRPEQGLIELRKGLGLYANYRPVRIGQALSSYSHLENKWVEGTDLVVVRELIGGAYRGEGFLTDDEAFDGLRYSRLEIERIAHVAFQLARQRQEEQPDRRSKVMSIDKANVLNTSKLWRSVVTEIGNSEYNDVLLEHMYVDNAAAQLIDKPAQFGVILTENMFGDILSDEAAMLNGSLGMTPSFSQGEAGKPTLSEPGHGSAPDIAGMGVANPMAMFLSAAMMLKHGLGKPDEAKAIETAVDQALDDNLRTIDLGGCYITTDEVTQAVLKNL
jgi:3-isopropylmalate dehydrogenase